MVGDHSEHGENVCPTTDLNSVPVMAVAAAEVIGIGVAGSTGRVTILNPGSAR